MIFLIHSEGKIFIKATKNDQELLLESKTVTHVFWELAEKYPEELIIWRDGAVDLELDDNVGKCFAHDLIMASCAVVNQFIPEEVGYVDQLPFVNPNYHVVYPTWRMSTDIGGIYGKTALNFKQLFKDIHDFGYLLNSISKNGQQSGLFCYSNPNLVNRNQVNRPNHSSDYRVLFNFVAQHYKRQWVWVLFFCLWKYDNRFPLIDLLNSLRKNSFFQRSITLPVEEIQQKVKSDEKSTIDVIIPTLFRAEYVKDLLKDLNEQSKFLSRVIIIEQDPHPESKSQINFLNEDWNFEIIHHFIHRTGACHARNLALKEVKSEWVLFADDDIRIEKKLLERSLDEIKRLGVNCLNLNSLQPGEKTVFPNIKQWGAFGSANALVNSNYALKCQFSESLEFGFGEDIDYGMQLRNIGCDIIYHPHLQFIHLKASRGGFRTAGINEWKEQAVEPKPSPTMMFLIQKYYSEIMMKGYKVSLFLKYYNKQPNKNLFRYFREMRKRWKLSIDLYQKLQKAE